MDSTVSSQGQPSKRLACNRCHQQKLRCHRNLLPGRPCARCENAGTECRFEPPLRPGRPSSRCKVQGLQKSAKDTETVIANSDQLNYASRHHTPSVGRQDIDVDLEGLGDSTRCDNAETAGSFLPLTFAAGYVSCILTPAAIDSMNLLYGSPYPDPDGSTDPALLFVDLPTNHDWMQLPISEPTIHQVEPHSVPQASLQPTPPSSGPSRALPSPPQPTTAATGCAIYRLVELTKTLYECYSALLHQSPNNTGSARSTYFEQGGDPALVDPTSRIDKIFSLTQSLAETLNGIINHCPYTRATDLSAANPPGPDTPTILMTLSCYVRLLHIYNSLFRSAKTSKILQTHPGSQSASTSSESIQNPVHFQMGSFSTSGAPSISLLACLSAHLLENLETALSNLASYAAHSSKDRGAQWEMESGPAASVAILAKAAVSEARSAQLDLRQQLQAVSSIALVSPPVSHWG
ncbi:Transcription factor ACEII [Penicillium samsonianum]|uniref:Transcription factor ACEII n=1 Tax=Penicillium samsonianum TaxID=1882272 RepID=UPI00254974EF|nr:Transcription factor ACEII [Penicillium samsonianum]KAJ6127791.1 Transcription factor ACEII [Penicillium samsonianum]